MDSHSKQHESDENTEDLELTDQLEALLPAYRSSATVQTFLKDAKPALEKWLKQRADNNQLGEGAKEASQDMPILSCEDFELMENVVQFAAEQKQS